MKRNQELLAKNFILNEHSKEYTSVNDANKICAELFDGDSLIEQYFNEIYA